MKKIGLICAALLAGISLTACSNTASQKSNKKSSSSSVTTTKAVKHHNVHKESKKDTQSSSSSAVSSQSNSQLPLNEAVKIVLSNKLCNQLSKAIRNQLHNQIAMDCHQLTTYTILLIAMANHLLPI